MALTVRQEGAALIVPAIERDRAVQVAGSFGVVAWRDGEDAYVLVREALAGADVIAVEKDHLTVRSAEALQAMAGVHRLADVSGEIRALRRSKSAAELEKLRHAADITDKAHEDVVGRIHLGQTELEVAAIIAAAISAHGGTLAFDSLVQFGAHTAFPHHHPSNRILREGDLILLDFGAAYEGYHADTTRMAVAGAPTDAQSSMHELVLEAHDAAEDHGLRGGRRSGRPLHRRPDHRRAAPHPAELPSKHRLSRARGPDRVGITVCRPPRRGSDALRARGRGPPPRGLPALRR